MLINMDNTAGRGRGRNNPWRTQKLLLEKKYYFDLVLSDIHMPGDMDGFKLLELIGLLKMDLPPVLMMSVYDKHDAVMKGVSHGTCDYLIKPIRIEALKIIWQHVVRKRQQTESKLGI